MFKLKTITSKLPTLSFNVFKSKAFLLILVAALLIGISVFMVNKYFYKKINPDYVNNSEFVGKSGESIEDKEATLIMFHVNWCMYCKKAMPEWLNFKKDYNGKATNGYKVILKEYECSDEDNEEIAELMDKYTVEGFPTIILVKDGSHEKFEAKPTYDTLEEFIKTM